MTVLPLHNVDDLSSLLDLLDVRHPSLCHQRNDRRCRLHNWSVHHSVASESEASSRFAVELGLLELVCMITELSAVISTFSSVSVLQQRNLHDLLNPGCLGVETGISMASSMNCEC